MSANILNFPNSKSQGVDVIVIDGAPIAKKRPRFARRGNYVTTYNCQETEEGKWLLRAIDQITTKHDGPVVLHCQFFMPIPKSTSKKKAAQMASGAIRHTKKPDLDNLVKFVKDCLNEVAWNDDSQVVALLAQKVYGDKPQTVVTVEALV